MTKAKLTKSQEKSLQKWSGRQRPESRNEIAHSLHFPIAPPGVTGEPGAALRALARLSWWTRVWPANKNAALFVHTGPLSFQVQTWHPTSSFFTKKKKLSPWIAVIHLSLMLCPLCLLPLTPSPENKTNVYSDAQHLDFIFIFISFTILWRKEISTLWWFKLIPSGIYLVSSSDII